jgi:drug/metabolite transporter (DMT)-like permease
VKQSFVGAVCLALAASIWGGMYVVSKYVLDYIPPFTLVWARYVIAFAVLFSVLKISEARNGKRAGIAKRDWLLLAWIGFVGYFASIALQFLGTKWTDAHTGALITSATPAFVVVFARFILKEKLTVRKAVSLLLATLGVVIVIGWDTQAGTRSLGSLMLVGAAITWALMSVCVKVASRRLSTLAITTYAVFIALVLTTPAMIWELQSHEVFYRDMSVLLGVVYLGVVASAGAFFLWNKGLELMDAGIGSLFFFFQPLAGSVLGWLLLGEHLDMSFYAGGFLIVAGVAVATSDFG